MCCFLRNNNIKVEIRLLIFLMLHCRDWIYKRLAWLSWSKQEEKNLKIFKFQKFFQIVVTFLLLISLLISLIITIKTLCAHYSSSKTNENRIFWISNYWTASFFPFERGHAHIYSILNLFTIICKILNLSFKEIMF